MSIRGVFDMRLVANQPKHLMSFGGEVPVRAAEFASVMRASLRYPVGKRSSGIIRARIDQLSTCNSFRYARRVVRGRRRDSLFMLFLSSVIAVRCLAARHCLRKTQVELNTALANVTSAEGARRGEAFDRCPRVRILEQKEAKR